MQKTTGQAGKKANMKQTLAAVDQPQDADFAAHQLGECHRDFFIGYPELGAVPLPTVPDRVRDLQHSTSPFLSIWVPARLIKPNSTYNQLSFSLCLFPSFSK